jgi:hypothetical protein
MFDNCPHIAKIMYDYLKNNDRSSHLEWISFTGLLRNRVESFDQRFGDATSSVRGSRNGDCNRIHSL